MSINQLLEKAEEIKSSKPRELSALLTLLANKKQQLSPEKVARFHYLKAYNESFNGNIDTAIIIADKIDLSYSNTAFKAKVAMFIANIAAIKEDWVLSLSNLNKGIELAEIDGNETTLASSYITAAITFNLLYQHKLAYEFALKLQPLNLKGRLKCVAQQVYVESGIRLNKIPTHSYEISKAIETCEQLSEFVWSNVIRVYVAQQSNNEELYLKAKSQLIPHLTDIEKTQYPRLISGAYSELSTAYYHSKEFIKAKSYALKIIDTDHSLQYSEPVVNAYKILYQIAKREKDIPKALEYIELYSNADKALMNSTNAKSIAFHVVSQQTKEKQNTIELLNKQNELLNNKNALLKIEQSLAKTEAENTRLVASLFFAIIALLVFFGYRSWQTQKRLKTLAEYDYLTKTHNRRHFMTLAHDTVKLAAKAKQTVTCIIFDLDKFKKVNDTYGHAAGDWALQATVSAVKECIREHDILARLGGEEFVILLPSCDIQAAVFVAEKCINRIQQINTEASGHSFSITASFGITTSKLSGYEVSNLVADADKALYTSKDNGRNQLTIFKQ